MGNPRGVRRDFDALEQRRMAAVALFGKGLNNSEIGRQLKVSNQTVSRWRKEYSEGGKAAMRQAGRAGRKPLLTAQQLQKLTRKLLTGPEKMGYDTPLWTSQRVAVLIEQEFGVRYHSGHVWRILRSLGWSPQRPVGRAIERDEKAIAEWKRVKWPAIKKKPVQKAAPLSSSTKAG
jgi:transposase